MGLGRVFDNRNAMLPTELQNRIHIGRLTKEMDGDDRLRSARQCAGQRFGSHRISPFVDIDKDWFRTTVGDRFGCRHERTRHGDNLIAGANSAGQQRQPDRLRSAAQPNRVVAFAKGSESFLKIGDRGSASKNSAIDHVGDGAFEMTPERSVMGFKI